ncbi:glutathione peroxidase [Flavobacterium agricola]|uniref:Glutathione peroxidase n=1 Tax=Flavobacterium agricola TaxID=2870839 RepID=A0ABY6M1L3_9FLAO|nr:glutathione peroxidase [Flavobacterium agricola]UYW02426.1 glutathione peroxidase [Flavobacterium agricola]
MIKFITGIGTLLAFLACSNPIKETVTAEQRSTMDVKPVYQYKVTAIDGETFDFADLKGKKIMVVNTASKCGLTPQYKALEEIYQKYKDSDFVIVGFPANNFMSQEPGTNEEIAEFCAVNYGVSFPMMEKISVKGSDMAPIYEYLTQKELNGNSDSEVTWNFQKYLINKDGFLEKVIGPRTVPDDPEVIAWIEQ